MKHIIKIKWFFLNIHFNLPIKMVKKWKLEIKTESFTYIENFWFLKIRIKTSPLNLLLLGIHNVIINTQKVNIDYEILLNWIFKITRKIPLFQIEFKEKLIFQWVCYLVGNIFILHYDRLDGVLKNPSSCQSYVVEKGCVDHFTHQGALSIEKMQ